MKNIKVDKVILYYMDRVDPDGNLYRFYVYKGMASEIEYFCTKEAGNMTIPIGEGEYVKIVPKEIEKIPVRGYRKFAEIWNRETCNGKGWYRLFNYFKYKPTLCYFKKAGHDENGNTRYEISLFNNIINVTRYFNLWRMKPGKYVMVTNECGALDIIKEKFDNININDDYTGLTDEECEEIHKIQDMERLNFETLFRIVRWDYNRCFKDESLDKDLFVEKYGRVMGEHYYNKFVHEFDGNILKMVGYFRGSEKEGQVFCDMITERIEKYEQRESYNRSKLNN